MVYPYAAGLVGLQRFGPVLTALYLDSSVKSEQVGAGDSPSRLGSVRPSVSRGVARSQRSSKIRTVGRARKPASCKVGSRRAHSEEAVRRRTRWERAGVY